MSQPAMSRALRELRAVFTFRLASSDYLLSVIAPPLLRQALAQSPGSTFRFDGWSDTVYLDAERGALDIIFTGGAAPPPLRSEPLFEDSYSCLLSAEHPLARAAKPTLDAYLDCDHVIINIAEARQGLVDTRLGALGRPRRANVTVPYASTTGQRSRPTMAPRNDPLGDVLRPNVRQPTLGVSRFRPREAAFGRSRHSSKSGTTNLGSPPGTHHRPKLTSSATHRCAVAHGRRAMEVARKRLGRRKEAVRPVQSMCARLPVQAGGLERLLTRIDASRYIERRRYGRVVVDGEVAGVDRVLPAA